MVARRNCTNNSWTWTSYAVVFFAHCCNISDALWWFTWRLASVPASPSVDSPSGGYKTPIAENDVINTKNRKKVPSQKTIPSVAINTIVPSYIEFRTVSRITEEKLDTVKPRFNGPSSNGIPPIADFFLSNYWFIYLSLVFGPFNQFSFISYIGHNKILLITDKICLFPEIR